MAEEKARDPTKQEMKPVNIPLSKIHDLPGSVFAPPSQKSLEALTSSIALKGVQEPVILRQREDGEFQIVSGNRRRKASEFAKKTEIPAFVYDMGEREAKEFRFRNKGEGTPPGKLLPESEIGKKRDAPEKAPDKSEDDKKPDAPLKAPEKPAGVKTVPTLEPKKPEEKSKAAPSPEKADAPPKPPEKPTEVKPTPSSGPKKPEEKAETAPPTEKADADGEKPDVPPKLPEKPVEVKPAPAYMPGPAALGPSGTKITKIFDERLMPPDEQAMKDLPVPKDGESYFITLHPAYLEKSEFNTVSVDTSSDDYKELKKSIELNGVKDPVLTRINPKGGLEILSGQRRHMIARELNYPVPAIIQKIDDNDAMILVADANLHRPHISTYDMFLETLRRQGYTIKRSPKVKHTAIRPTGGQRFVRLASLGDGYTELDLMQRLNEQRYEPPPTLPVFSAQKRYTVRSRPRCYPLVKRGSFRALYLYYLYLLSPRKKRPQKVPFETRAEIRRAKQYRQQFFLLQKYHIDTKPELDMLSDALSNEMQILVDQRKELYALRREQPSEQIDTDIDALTAQLRPLRRELRICGKIAEYAPRMLKQIWESNSTPSTENHAPEKARKRRHSLWR